MNNDLVKRLREGCGCEFVNDECEAKDECRDAFEAADRIEALEKALRFYAEYVPRFSGQDFRSVARAALEGKDD